MHNKLFSEDELHTFRLKYGAWTLATKIFTADVKIPKEELDSVYDLSPEYNGHKQKEKVLQYSKYIPYEDN